MTINRDDVDAINDARMDLMTTADRLPEEFAKRLRAIVDDLSDLTDDMED